MKHFLFWLLVAVVGIFWLHAARERRFEATAPATVVVADVVGPDGRPGPTAYVDRHGKVIELVRDEPRYDGQVQIRREPADGLPVPVVPGSRTTEARVETPSPGNPDAFDNPFSPPAPRPRPRAVKPPLAPRVVRLAPDLLVVKGRLSANEQRARDDARSALERIVTDRLAPEVPREWKVPPALIDGMIREVIVTPRERDYGTVFEATLKADFSPQTRAEVVAVYHREQVMKRLAVLGAVLAFVLVCLAALSGYIKADEATRGYYTNRLRLAAAAGVGAAGVVLYRVLA